MKNKRLWMIVPAVLLVAALICVCTGTFAESTGKIGAEEIDGILNTSTDPAQITSPFIDVSNKVRTSVVGVNNYQNVSTYSIGGWGFGWGYGNDYGRGAESRETLYGTGSGVVITEYGHILTNYHVIENATRVTITVDGDESEHEAIVVGTDSDLDLAVLYVPGMDLVPVELGDSDALQVGEWAIVIGNPLGEDFARTVTIGVVSALDRVVTDTSYDRYGRRTSITNKMIQVDAAINSGNSGGGMFNMLGQLQGIPARKYSTSYYSQSDVDNIGMCIPINVAKPLIRQVLENFSGDAVTAGNSTPAEGGDLTGKPRMGVTVLTLRNTNNTALPNGAYIVSVEEGSPAAKAGLKAGDIVVAVNDTVVSNQTALTAEVGKFGAGDTLKVTVFRLDGITEIVDTESWTADLTALAQMEDGNYIDTELTLEIVDKVQNGRK